MGGEGMDEENLEGEGKRAGIYALGESGEGRRPGALPDRGAAKPGRGNTSTQITNIIKGAIVSRKLTGGII